MRKFESVQKIGKNIFFVRACQQKGTAKAVLFLLLSLQREVKSAQKRHSERKGTCAGMSVRARRALTQNVKNCQGQPTERNRKSGSFFVAVPAEKGTCAGVSELKGEKITEVNLQYRG